MPNADSSVTMAAPTEVNLHPPRPGLIRWGIYSLVGLCGVFIQLVTLVGLKSGMELHYLLATALAVEAAVLHNFCWHVRWTWSDRRVQSGTETLYRLLRFNLTVGCVSIFQNLFLMGLLVDQLGMHYLIANMMTIAMCSLLNYITSDRLVFKNPSPKSTRVSQEEPTAES